MEASREMDMQVHKALWPEADVQLVNGHAWCDLSARRAVPRYSTDLGAWDGVGEGWMWEINESTYRVQVILRITPYHSYIYAEATYAECKSRHAAWALGMSRCVLQWQEAGDGTTRV